MNRLPVFTGAGSLYIGRNYVRIRPGGLCRFAQSKSLRRVSTHGKGRGHVGRLARAYLRSQRFSASDHLYRHDSLRATAHTLARAAAGSIRCSRSRRSRSCPKRAISTRSSTSSPRTRSVIARRGSRATWWCSLRWSILKCVRGCARSARRRVCTASTS